MSGYFIVHYTNRYIYIDMSTHVDAHTYIHHMHIHVCIYIYAYICIHIHTDVYTHTLKHTPSCHKTSKFSITNYTPSNMIYKILIM